MNRCELAYPDVPGRRVDQNRPRRVGTHPGQHHQALEGHQAQAKQDLEEGKNQIRTLSILQKFLGIPVKKASFIRSKANKNFKEGW